MVLYKCWVTFIIYGLLNGLVLLPVALSLIGPLDAHKVKDKAIDKQLKTDIEIPDKETSEGLGELSATAKIANMVGRDSC